MFSADAYVLTLSGASEIPRGLKWCVALRRLDVSGCPKLRRLDGVPDHVEGIYATGSGLREIGALPAGLRVLWIGETQVRRLEGLPRGLHTLMANDLCLRYVQALPPGLVVLNIANCGFVRLPTLPPTLRQLDVSGNPLAVVEKLPENLVVLTIGSIEGPNGSYVKNGLSIEAELPYELRKLVLKGPVSAAVPPYLKELVLPPKEHRYSSYFLRILSSTRVATYAALRHPMEDECLPEDADALLKDVCGGDWRLRNLKRDRMRIILDFLSCCPLVQAAATTAHA